MRLVFLFLTLFCVAVSPLFAAPDREGKDFLKVPIAKTRAENKWALVIGIDGYINAAPLQICGKDARAFRNFLQTKMGFPSESILFLTDDATDVRMRPTYTALKKQINIFLEGVDENSEVVLFFSGHGVRANDRDWLVPLDGDPDSVSETCIDYNALRDKLETKRPRRALLITDACRNLLEGKSITRGSGFGASEVADLPQFGELRSCQPREVSRWLTDGSMSVFTHYLLAGLSGSAAGEDGRVTFDNLRGFVTGKTRQYVAANWKSQQNPDGRASFGEMVLAQSAPVVVPVATPTPRPKLPSLSEILKNRPASPKPEAAKPAIVKPASQPTPTPEVPWKIDLPLPESSKTPATGPTTRINPRDGAEMVWIPAGNFKRGMETSEIAGAVAAGKANGEAAEAFWFEANTPAKVVALDGFWIYKTEVTYGQYRAFCEATGRVVPQNARDPQWDKYPVNAMTWDDARAYAQWAGGDLPTESQWEKAARGPQNLDYPWGNQWDGNKSVNKKAGAYPVAFVPTDVSGYGVFDMAGNVREWCRDSYDPDFYQKAPLRNSWNSTESYWKAARGGSWSDLYPSSRHRTTYRSRYLASWTEPDTGFRVVIAP